jgi:hypothetical protein
MQQARLGQGLRKGFVQQQHRSLSGNNEAIATGASRHGVSANLLD